MSALSKLVLATGNKGKIAELAAPLRHLNIEVMGLTAFPGLPPVEETGATFEENALLKARAAAAATGLPALADDSGLCVDALNGAPGIYSARYGSDLPLLPDESQDARNIRKLLAALKDVPEGNRGGSFICVMAAALPNGYAVTAKGSWKGQLLSAQKGSNGFGYDPVFYIPELGRTVAELSREEKMTLSHRALALKGLLRLWPEFWQKAKGRFAGAISREA